MRVTPFSVLALLAATACAGGPRPPAQTGGTPAPEVARPAAPYLGSASCRGCHPGAFERWRRTAHATDYAGLPAAERANPVCLRCHVTGYAEPLGFGRGGGPESLAAVGCEACHAGAADHARSRYPDLVPTATGGECPPCEVNRICRLCHTPERSPDFDLARALERISCGGGGSRQR